MTKINNKNVFGGTPPFFPLSVFNHYIMARQKTNIIYQHRMFLPSILKEASTNGCVIYSFIYVCLITFFI